LEEMKQAGIRGEKKYLQEYHAKRSIEIVCPSNGWQSC
jgi:hypothetical protein